MLGATNAGFIASTALVVLAAAACVFNGLYWLGIAFPVTRRKAVARASYVLAPVTLGLLAADIGYTATRPMSGEVAVAGLGQSLSR